MSVLWTIDLNLDASIWMSHRPRMSTIGLTILKPTFTKSLFAVNGTINASATETQELLLACPCPFPPLSNQSGCQFALNFILPDLQGLRMPLPDHRNCLQAYAIDSNLPLQRVTMAIFLIYKSDGVSLQFRIFNDSPIASVIKTKSLSVKYKTHSALGLKPSLFPHFSQLLSHCPQWTICGFFLF